MFLRSFACTLHTRCRRVLAPRGTGCVAVHRSFRRRAGQRRQVLFQPYRPPPGPVLQNHRQARRQKMPTTPLPIPAGLILTGLPRWHARLVGRCSHCYSCWRGVFACCAHAGSIRDWRRGVVLLSTRCVALTSLDLRGTAVTDGGAVDLSLTNSALRFSRIQLG
jgi:hypothetical protein